MLTTKRFFLMPATLPMLEAAIRNDQAMLSSLLGGVYFTDGWLDVSPDFGTLYTHLQADSSLLGWQTYFAIQGMDARVAGTCGFQGKPDAHGNVYIHCHFGERYNQRDLLRETIEVLTKFVWRNPLAQAVIATTNSGSDTNALAFQDALFEGNALASSEWQWRLSRPYSS